MLRRLSRKAIETLEFRGVLVVLALVAVVILYFSIFTRHRPPADDPNGLPAVPAGDTTLPVRR